MSFLNVNIARLKDINLKIIYFILILRNQMHTYNVYTYADALIYIFIPTTCSAHRRITLYECQGGSVMVYDSKFVQFLLDVVEIYRVCSEKIRF